MRIKSLEILGFKSFADRAIIHFDEGVTGIVGPNGCGKSNVVDALRWVMGEQNPKSLRGGHMQDVIFNGSEKRNAVGFAEVTLTLENDGQQIASEYSSYKEIQVSRRLYKTGDSEYEINRQTCRLKDITELFLGTGVGTKAYSVIEQGQISALISAKPEDRRLIIEEAAGITKYEAKKRAAERKIESTRQNLSRVSDVLREVETQLGSLERQAKKAERFHRLKAELRKSDMHLASLKYLEHLSVFRYLDAQKLSLENTICLLQEELDRCMSGFDGQKQTLSQADTQIQMYQAMAYEADNSIALNKKEVTFLDSNAENNRNHIRRLNDEIHRLEASKKDLVSQKETTSAQLKDVETDLKSITLLYDQEQNELQSLKNDRDRASQKLIEAQSMTAGSANVASKAQLEMQSQAIKRDQFYTKNSEIKKELEFTKEKISHISLKIEGFEEEFKSSTQKKEDNRVAEKSIKEKIYANNLELEKLDKALSFLEREITQNQSRLVSLRELEASFASSSQGVSHVMNQVKVKDIASLAMNLIAVPKEYEQLVEEALFYRLESIVVKDTSNVMELIGDLSVKKAGRVRFYSSLPVDPLLPSGTERMGPRVKRDDDNTVPVRIVDKFKIADGYQDLFEQILGDIILVESLDEALIRWPHAIAHRLTLVAPNGELFCPDGAIVGGKPTKTNGMLARKREMRDLDDIILNVQTKLQTVAEEHRKIKENKNLLYRQKDDLQRSDQDVSIKIVRLEEMLTASRNEQNGLNDRINKLNSEADANNKFLESFNLEHDKLKATWADALRANEDFESKLQTHRESLAAFDKILADKLEQVTNHRIKLASGKERFTSLQHSFLQAAKSLDDTIVKLEEHAHHLTQMSNEQVTFQEKREILLQKIEVATKEATILHETLTHQRTEYDALKTIFSQAEAGALLLRKKMDVEKAALMELSLAVQESNLKIKGIDSRLYEIYRVRVKDVLRDFHCQPSDLIALEREIKDQKRMIEQLGSVNENAVNEFNELKARHGFLQTQSGDLNTALNQLEEAISRINSATARRFKEAFDAINERFAQVFPRLFRGGKAWLELTNDSDLLSCGVEIFAQPPGKKLGAMALMSGGEKALTAASLIFAIFLIKPSPFCLLDEVDAPLDEANVGRFSNLIKEMSNISQFIVITHNKRTMEAIDHLYGVTMEQAGVSKLVSVKLKNHEGIKENTPFATA